MERREFLKRSSVAGVGSLLAPTLARASRMTDSHIEVLINEPIGDISPHIYGHFIEHIGSVIYDGVWVGKDSKIANVQGVRKALIEKLREIKPPMIRWPGGCFADSYDWRDGVGAERPRRTNFWAAEFDRSKVELNAIQMYEPNTFGTAEFLRLCRQTGAEPYLAANVRSLSALDFDHWVEYCNSPAGSTSLAEARAKDGSAEPYNVKLWGIGNESWGCGGDFTPQDYATEFRRYTSWVPPYGLSLEFIASGPNGNDPGWTRGFFEKLYSTGDQNISGWSIHYYAWNMSRGKTDDWVKAKGDALQFDTTDWYESFRQGYAIEKIIEDQWAAMGEYDREHDIKLVVDEYGPWYRSGTEISPESILSQQVTMRDALFTALTLDIFNRHADKVHMAACAQLINCMNALFLAHGKRFVVTPNFYVFQMYAAHQAAQAVRTEVSAPAVKYMRDGKAAEFWGLNGSASLKAKTLTLTVVNADASTARETEVVVRGAAIHAASAKVLSNPDIHAHNSFEHTQVAEPASTSVEVAGSLLRFTFPPASVTGITVTLA